MSYRMFHLMCPTGPDATNIPTVSEQIHAARNYRPAWRPPRECNFILRPLAEGEERPTLEGAYRTTQWAEIWRDNYTFSSDNNVRMIASQYRCETHGLPPRVFRQDHAYRVNRERRPNTFVRVLAANNGRGDRRVVWPEEHADYNHSVYVYIRQRPTPRTTHTLWPST